MQSRNHLLFFLTVLLLLGSWWALRTWVYPEKKDAGQVAERPDKTKKSSPASTEPGRFPALPEVTPDNRLVWIGARDEQSPFHLAVALDPLAGGVRSVWLNKFKEADRDGRPTGEMLELVPDAANRLIPAFALYGFDPDNVSAEDPLDTLGRTTWEVVKKDGKAVVVDQTDDGRQRQQVSFRTTLPVRAGGDQVGTLTITRTYTLIEREYHLGMAVEIKRSDVGKDAGPAQKKPIQFRYQLAGARGLPVEGKWYTHTFRNAYIAMVDTRGNVVRERDSPGLQELRQIAVWGGGDHVDRTDDLFIRYAGVAVQYFASVIVVDTDQDQGQGQKFLHRARPTLETGVVRGKLKARLTSGPKGPTDRVVVLGEDGTTEDTIYVPADLRDKVDDIEKGQPIAVIYRPLSFDPRRKETPRLAVDIRGGSEAEATQRLWEDDITVRVATEPAELKPGDTVTHRYLLYHGPVKPSLLSYVRKHSEAVAPELVNRYAFDLGLNKMIDYPSAGFMGKIGQVTQFSYLVSLTTNLMHWLLGKLNWVVPIYGICIILLTVMVRGMMFPLSRKQALMSVKMQALAPEVKKLSEKYKDDHQALGRAQMELWRKHGVNPLGSCWVLLLQMPIFMGLYYALQESIQFRLAPFLYIENLAAPDMLFRWGESIPLLSRVVDYGGFLYLGPYLNLLPIIAVSLMMVQQKMMTPPPADEQQAMQQKMMKWMMVVFGLMFYKVAAGLCIYFIASSLWGFAERKLLPKAKPTGGTEPAGGGTPAGNNKASEQITTKPAAVPAGITQGRKPGRNKRRDRKAKEEPASGLGQMRQRLSDWLTDLLDKARKK
jgi:YidC/Oxa1 family membrane protein insertase